ncbi:MAG: hypothetical protein COS71_04065 [Candidatus Moranbacteria bacterium CG06_land_8_20_14_3_00_40_12]|nr:MAG: hypothetical protein COX31_00310 [Candidatus Moranbacteria bacterium CG23_combo_of_CG06-09_8_20_14_all_40_16]PIU80337.1 MAG: hypothetical protein COS71_04065 [Candidatus Moranbacteria bacterium CG06_land_8_20_14_3_00_40_12]
MAILLKLWKNFKVQPEIWFFYGFLLTFTLTIRKVLWFLPLRGEFNEYAGTYLYLSDIILGLAILTGIITILYNKIDILSILKNVPPQKQNNCSIPEGMFHVEHSTGQAWNNYLLRGRRGIMVYILLPLVLVVWSFISFIWAENKIVSIFRSMKILEFYLLYVFVVVRFFYWNVPSRKECSIPEGMFHSSRNVPPQQKCSTWNILRGKRGTSYGASVEHSTGQAWNILRGKRGTILKKIFSLIMIIGLFQAIIGIIQFFLQHSIGLFWLKESLVSPDIAGVAKVILNGGAFIRAYGLFPHPNILGGFLVFSIFVSMLYYKMFHLPAGRQVWNNLLNKRRTIIKIFLGIQLLALILTFSKSAILSLILGLVYYAYMNVPPACRQAGVEHPTGQAWNILRDKRGIIINFFIKKKRLLVIAGLILFFSIFILKPDWNSLLIKSLDERSVYVSVSPARIAIQSIAGGRGTIEDLKTLIFGIGNSQFVVNMEKLPVIKENWMLEPVHNVFLLVGSELGLIGFVFFIVFLVYVFKNIPSQEQKECSTWNIPLLRDKCETILEHKAIVEQSPALQSKTTENLKNTFGAIFIGLLFIMFFDHYLWDIQQGNFLLWMTLGFLAGTNGCEKD